MIEVFILTFCIFFLLRFLPYTIHFEVERSKIPTLAQDEMIEPIGGLSPEGDVTASGNGSHQFQEKTAKAEHLIKGSFNSEDSTVSILKSLANNNFATNSAAEDSDYGSVSSTETDIGFENKERQHEQKAQLGVSANASDTVSVQDFFFNNPNSSRLSLSSASLNDNQLRSSTEYLGAGVSGSVYEKGPFSSMCNLPTNKKVYVKPRPFVLRNSSMGDLTLRPSLDRHRSTHSLMGNLSKTLLARKLKKSGLPVQNTAFVDSKNAFEGDGDTAGLINDDTVLPYSMGSVEGYNVSSNDARSLKPASGDKADKELAEYFADKTDIGNVIPFGGFARDYGSILEDKNNVFATAPWKVVTYEHGNGGLRNAVRLAEGKNKLHDVKWIGTPGMPCELVPKCTKEAIYKKLKQDYDSETIFIEDDTFEGYYDRYCKQILWPILQYQLPEEQKANSFINDSWEDYVYVNRQFANRVLKLYKKGDSIWIHDYHLMLVPGMVRKALPDAKIGFFLHVSFPSSEVFRCLAQREKILRGMLGADCIGMQTDEYVAHFLQSCNRLLLADFDEHGVRYDNRTISVTYNPIGVDAHALRKVLNGEVVRNWRTLVRERWPDKTLIVSRDKIDKIRGVKEKLLAYEKFLTENPEYIETTLLLLICIPGRASADQKLENEILTIVERINSRAPNIASERPVVVLNQDITFEQYLALLSEAGLFVVSTLREGMNLTSHEFVEASYEDHSPLILSEFVGSATVLCPGALITNPYNVRQVSNAIKQCMEMSSDERERRWKAMHAAVLRHDSLHWINGCIQSIEQGYKLNTSQQSCDVKQLMWSHINDAIVKSVKAHKSSTLHSRMFFMNFNELISNLKIQGTSINPIQQRFMDNILNNLASDPTNSVYLLGSSTQSEMWMGCRSLVDVGLIAESGGYVKLSTESEFVPLISDKKLRWVSAVEQTMKSWSERIPGTYVEKESSIVKLHTEGSHDIDREHKEKLIGELMTHINELYGHDYNVHAKFVDQIVIVREMDSITRALNYIIAETPGKIGSNNISFIMVAGGTSPDDEELYNYFKSTRNKFNGNVLNVEVGTSKKSTGADFKLQGVNHLLIALSQIS